MNILSMLKKLWPLLKPRVVAVLATQIKALAARTHVTLSDTEALEIAVLVVRLLEDLIDRDDAADPLVAQAAKLLSAKPA